MDADVKALSDTLIYEILFAIGLPKTARLHAMIRPLFQRATGRLADLGVTFDRAVRESGFARAADGLLRNFIPGVLTRGDEGLPPAGPLLVVSNHPGAYDSLVIASRVGRDDIKFITSDIPFLQNLPHAYSHFINTTLDVHNRMASARAAIRHLQAGGAVLLFGSGHIDPDPAIFPDAEKHIERWYPSIDLFLRLAPQAKLLMAMVSGVLSRDWGYHPVTWLRKQGLDKRRIAEFGQIIQQLLTGKMMSAPNVSFAAPVSVAELRQESQSERLLPAIIARAKSLLTEHVAWAVP